MTDLTKVIVNIQNNYYYVATVNGGSRLNMPAHVSVRMQHIEKILKLSVYQMYNLHLKMRAVRLYQPNCLDVQLVIEEIGNVPGIIKKPGEGSCRESEDSDSDWDSGLLNF